jgi:hypothetical protein
MKPVPLLLSILLSSSALLASPASAGEKRVMRIDSLIASQKGGAIELKAKGAVPTGGWSRPRLHVLHNDGHVVTVEFLATPPPSEMTVIDALVPVTASVEVKGRAASVHLLADQNEVTSEVLR